MDLLYFSVCWKQLMKMDGTNERQWGYITHTPNTPSIAVKHSWVHVILGTEARALCLCTPHLPPSRLAIHHADWHSAMKGQPLYARMARF